MEPTRLLRLGVLATIAVIAVACTDPAPGAGSSSEAASPGAASAGASADSSAGAASAAPSEDDAYPDDYVAP